MKNKQLKNILLTSAAAIVVTFTPIQIVHSAGTVRRTCHEGSGYLSNEAVNIAFCFEEFLSDSPNLNLYNQLMGKLGDLLLSLELL